jgi:hypothetical protein
MGFDLRREESRSASSEVPRAIESDGTSRGRLSAPPSGEAPGTYWVSGRWQPCSWGRTFLTESANSSSLGPLRRHAGRSRCESGR